MPMHCTPVPASVKPAKTVHFGGNKGRHFGRKVLFNAWPIHALDWGESTKTCADDCDADDAGEEEKQDGLLVFRHDAGTPYCIINRRQLFTFLRRISRMLNEVIRM